MDLFVAAYSIGHCHIAVAYPPIPVAAQNVEDVQDTAAGFDGDGKPAFVGPLQLEPLYVKASDPDVMMPSHKGFCPENIAIKCRRPTFSTARTSVIPHGTLSYLLYKTASTGSNVIIYRRFDGRYGSHSRARLTTSDPIASA